MSLRQELVNWQLKRSEAERNSKLNLDDYSWQEKWGNAQRMATENINRIDNVLAVRPWSDELEAEELRHYKAVDVIRAKY